MEVFGFDFESAKPLLSERHVILGLIVVAAAAVVVRHVARLRRQASRPHELKRHLRTELEALPFAGRGLRFFTLTVGLNFAFGVTAQCGERGPHFGGDAFGWLLGALVVAIVMAFTTRAILRRLPEIAAAIFAFFLGLPAAPSAPSTDRTGEARCAVFDAWPPTCFSRPPPILQL